VKKRSKREGKLEEGGGKRNFSRHFLSYLLRLNPGCHEGKEKQDGEKGGRKRLMKI